MAAVLGAVAGLVRYAVKGRSSQIFGPSVWKGRSARRSIALTFDDGPSPGTLEILDYLEEQQVRATFFMCGANIERHPEIALKVHRAGHEIGNHSFSHRRLCPRIGRQTNLLTRSEVYREFAKTQRALRKLGIRPVLLRAPYGMRWFGLRETQRRLGLMGVMWTVIGHDWELEAAKVAALVLDKVVPGAIICLHDGRETRPNSDVSPTLVAVRRVVPALRQQGYSFQCVSQLFTEGKG